MGEWIETASERPECGVAVETKIDDQNGIRNEEELVFFRNLWWFPDRSMYVYYVPTHWRHKADNVS